MPGPYWCIRLTTRALKSRLYRLPKKTTTYILHVLIVPVTAQTHVRRKSVGEKETKKNKEEKGKERKGKKAKKEKRKRK